MEVYEVARELLADGCLEESHETFTRFIETQETLKRPEMDKTLADSLNSRGHIRYLWVDFDAAIEDYTAAIERNSGLAVAYYNRGQVHYRLGR